MSWLRAWTEAEPLSPDVVEAARDPLRVAELPLASRAVSNWSSNCPGSLAPDDDVAVAADTDVDVELADDPADPALALIAASNWSSNFPGSLAPDDDEAVDVEDDEDEDDDVSPSSWSSSWPGSLPDADDETPGGGPGGGGGGPRSPAIWPPAPWPPPAWAMPWSIPINWDRAWAAVELVSLDEAELVEVVPCVVALPLRVASNWSSCCPGSVVADAELDDPLAVVALLRVARSWSSNWPGSEAEVADDEDEDDDDEDDVIPRSWSSSWPGSVADADDDEAELPDEAFWSWLSNWSSICPALGRPCPEVAPLPSDCACTRAPWVGPPICWNAVARSLALRAPLPLLSMLSNSFPAWSLVVPAGAPAMNSLRLTLPSLFVSIRLKYFSRPDVFPEPYDPKAPSMMTLLRLCGGHGNPTALRSTQASDEYMRYFFEKIACVAV